VIGHLPSQIFFAKYSQGAVPTQLLPHNRTAHRQRRHQESQVIDLDSFPVFGDRYLREEKRSSIWSPSPDLGLRCRREGKMMLIDL